MTVTEAATLITALATLVTAIGGIWVSLRNMGKINRVHDAVNGQTGALVDLTARSSFAEGVEAERDTPGTVGKTHLSPRGEFPHNK